jgi:hypothetical protein
MKRRVGAVVRGQTTTLANIVAGELVPRRVRNEIWRKLLLCGR